MQYIDVQYNHFYKLDFLKYIFCSFYFLCGSMLLVTIRVSVAVFSDWLGRMIKTYFESWQIYPYIFSASKKE